MLSRYSKGIERGLIPADDAVTFEADSGSSVFPERFSLTRRRTLNFTDVCLRRTKLEERWPAGRFGNAETRFQRIVRMALPAGDSSFRKVDRRCSIMPSIFFGFCGHTLDGDHFSQCGTESKVRTRCSMLRGEDFRSCFGRGQRGFFIYERCRRFCGFIVKKVEPQARGSRQDDSDRGFSVRPVVKFMNMTRGSPLNPRFLISEKRLIGWGNNGRTDRYRCLPRRWDFVFLVIFSQYAVGPCNFLDPLFSQSTPRDVSWKSIRMPFLDQIPVRFSNSMPIGTWGEI